MHADVSAGRDGPCAACRALKRPHEDLAAHAAAAVFHSCEAALAAVPGGGAWTAERLLAEFDTQLRTYVQLSCWLRLYPLKSAREAP